MWGALAIAVALAIGVIMISMADRRIDDDVGDELYQSCRRTAEGEIVLCRRCGRWHRGGQE